ncbi:hypothetical protein EUZ85_02295 [Hahella sp. KA22]|uniref:imm11 family protein n=1 Tax=Hahella sp. KA22 TaxID=1628392 RepID=UPI000FDE378B|nr:DUF1629 domain-containing protein [Hahella sp. KA22]AZZ95324.1 hypothetical protein ENC22_30585 [Hahella sp. KA22]QAY52969.1 hypothetical protein EUZ85_02295 [Hahella sp. KA22]
MAEIYPEDIGVTMSNEFPGRVLTDFIANVELCLIVSKAVKETMVKVNQGPIEYLPLWIYNHKSRLESKDYFYVNPLGTYDVLSLEKSHIKFFEDTDKVVRVYSYVLSREKLNQPNLPDIFRIKEWPKAYVISQRMLEALQAMNPAPVNLVVEKIEIHEDVE